MKKTFTLLLFAVFGLIKAEAQQVYFVPQVRQNVQGSGSFTSPLSSSDRTYQMLIHDSMLTALQGNTLTGISFRVQATVGTWPATVQTYSDYDVYLSGSVDPVNRSTTFINNIVGPQTQVRSGSLTIPVNAITGGVNPGFVIDFTTPYVYTGGNLLIELRHTGATTSRAVEAITTSSPGYGEGFSATWIGDYIGTTGNNGNFAVVGLAYLNPLSIGLVDFTVVANKEDAVASWMFEKEHNPEVFNLERSVNGADFMTVFMTTPNESGQYSFRDLEFNKLPASKVYYRLRTSDKSGIESYSKVVTLQKTGGPVVVTITPNPVEDRFRINFWSAEEQQVVVSITDIAGKIIREISQTVRKGDNALIMDATELPSGLYLVQVSGTGVNAQLKMVKQ